MRADACAALSLQRRTCVTRSSIRRRPTAARFLFCIFALFFSHSIFRISPRNEFRSIFPLDRERRPRSARWNPKHPEYRRKMLFYMGALRLRPLNLHTIPNIVPIQSHDQFFKRPRREKTRTRGGDREISEKSRVWYTPLAPPPQNYLVLAVLAPQRARIERIIKSFHAGESESESECVCPRGRILVDPREWKRAKGGREN